MNYLVQKVNKPLHIAVEVPGSKSITNRALLMVFPKFKGSFLVMIHGSF